LELVRGDGQDAVVGRHSLVEHTGEVEVRLEAATAAELFAEAARALAEIMGGPFAAPDREGGVAVRLEAPDRNALLVDWLNELVFLAERDKRLYGATELDHVSDRELSARVFGREIEDLRLHVKAATFHGLDIREGPGGLSANVVLDI
jgi:SHS2 domain-containing protein